MSGATHRIITTSVLIGLQILIEEPRDLEIMRYPWADSIILLPLVLVAGWVGTMLPDLDLRYLRTHRWLGHMLPHRGPTHSLLLSLIGGGACYGTFALMGFPTIGFAIIVGWLTHIIADALTPSGVALLWPRRRRMRLLPKRLCIRSVHEPILQRLAVIVIVALIGLKAFQLTM